MYSCQNRCHSHQIRNQWAQLKHTHSDGGHLKHAKAMKAAPKTTGRSVERSTTAVKMIFVRRVTPFEKVLQRCSIDDAATLLPLAPAIIAASSRTPAVPKGTTRVYPIFVAIDARCSPQMQLLVSSKAGGAVCDPVTNQTCHAELKEHLCVLQDGSEEGHLSHCLYPCGS